MDYWYKRWFHYWRLYSEILIIGGVVVTQHLQSLLYYVFLLIFTAVFVAIGCFEERLAEKRKERKRAAFLRKWNIPDDD